MVTMEPTRIHLKPEQKKALQVRARTNNTNVAEEVRRAIDAYLDGISQNELAMLDEATKSSAAMLAEMNKTLKDTNEYVQAVFEERDRIRAARK